MVVTELPCKKRSTASSSTTSEEKKETKTHADYLEALRDLQTAWIAKLGEYVKYTVATRVHFYNRPTQKLTVKNTYSRSF